MALLGASTVSPSGVSRRGVPDAHAAHLAEVLIGLDPVALPDRLLDLHRQAPGQIAQQVLQAESDHGSRHRRGCDDSGQIHPNARQRSTKIVM